MPAFDTVTIASSSPSWSVTLTPVARVLPELDVSGSGASSRQVGRDVNNHLYTRDVPVQGPIRLTIAVYKHSMSLSDWNRILDAAHFGYQVTVTDNAATAPEAQTTDAYYKTYTGRIASVAPDSYSPFKIGTGPFNIVVLVQSTTSLTVS